MSSGFVSGGTSEQPRERNELWQKAEQELEAARQRQLEQKNHDGKSLYEVLQENKAAKQEAFEESIKLKHQFRSLDEDDVAFLNSIREAESAKERAVQQETLDRLDAFRKHQQEVESGASGDPSTADTETGTKSAEETPSWQVAPKKRKREPPVKGLKGVKMAKIVKAEDLTADKDQIAKQTPAAGGESKVARTGAENSPVNKEPLSEVEAAVTKSKPVTSISEGQRSAKAPVTGLGLGGYSSDED